MRHGNCYVCDHHTHLSNRGRCADCERDRARENERENDKLREQLAKSEQYIYDLTNADTGEVPTLEAQLAAAESQIDALMLEYCPDEMSKEQLDNWEKHQRPVDDTMEGRRSMGDPVVFSGMTKLFLEPPPAIPDEDYFADACRLAMELECLLLDCKDTAVSAKWWESANEALDQHRERIEQMRKEQK